MARITHVKAAQQRYEAVPVLDESGNQVYRTVTLPRPTKRGKTSYEQKVTREDRTKPLDPETCGACHEPILPGTPYKWVQTKNTYGGTRHTRHEDCPTWQPWDLSNSLSARVARIQDGGQSEIDAAEGDSPDDFAEVLSGAADEADDLAGEKRDSQSSIEDGFGHETEQSAELGEQADALETWAETMRNIEIPDLPEPDEVDCDTCDGTGEVENGEHPGVDPTEPEMVPCDECEGTGQITPDDPTDEQMDAWRDEVREVLSEALNEVEL